MPSATSVAFSGNPDIDGLLQGTKWADSSLSYSFAHTLRLNALGILSVGVDTFNAGQQLAIRSVLQSVSGITPLSFVEVAETSSSQGALRFGESATQTTATGYYPSNSVSGGDAWFNLVDYNSPVPGSYAFLTMMHETGHTLGLDHGHEGAYALPADHDTLEYSVMTYRSYVSSPTGGYSVGEGSYPRSFMLDDLGALQYLYGANYATNAGATIYHWDPATGELSINGSRQGASTTNTILETIWDGGGTDTYDFSAYTTGVRVDINPGAWTTTSGAQLALLGQGHLARGNIASAYLAGGNPASLIENVTGGSGNDWISGNAAVNRLVGGRGSDTLIGGLGVDVLKGGKDADHFVFVAALGQDNIEIIEDFKHGVDLVDLDDPIFVKVGSSVSAGEFYAKDGAHKGHDKSDRIIYNSHNGKLFYDDDGNKAGGHAAVHFATLANHPGSLTFYDFAVV